MLQNISSRGIFSNCKTSSSCSSSTILLGEMPLSSSSHSCPITLNGWWYVDFCFLGSSSSIQVSISWDTRDICGETSWEGLVLSFAWFPPPLHSGRSISTSLMCCSPPGPWLQDRFPMLRQELNPNSLAESQSSLSASIFIIALGAPVILQDQPWCLYFALSRQKSMGIAKSQREGDVSAAQHRDWKCE